jgi:hypothetical protein
MATRSRMRDFIRWPVLPPDHSVNAMDEPVSRAARDKSAWGSLAFDLVLRVAPLPDILAA